MGKTVTTYLIDGDPKGTQYSFISNKICQMFVVPRSNLSYLNEQEKLQKPAFYILIGEDEATKPQAYIGETENFKERVKDHDSKKAFWQKALIFVSKDEDMTKADVQYLEHKAIAEAKKANTFVLGENKQIPKAPQPARASAGRYGRVFRGYQVLGFLYGVQHLRHSPAQGRTFVLHERARMQRKGLLPFVGLYRLEGQSCGKRQCSVFPLDGKEGENDERIWGIG